MTKFSVIFLTISLAVFAIASTINRNEKNFSAATGAAAIGGSFALTDHKGQLRTEKDFAGKYMLVYFGYTYCPDICPTDLSALSKTLRLLNENSENVAAIFITVDPERDTVTHLATYMENFDPRITALTGSTADIESAKKAYKVYSAKATAKNSVAEYLIDHSAFIYLMDRNGHYLTHFAHGTDAKTMAERINQLPK